MSFELLTSIPESTVADSANAPARPLVIPEPVKVTNHKLCKFVGMTLERRKSRKPHPVRKLIGVERRYVTGFGVTTVAGYTVPGSETEYWVLAPGFAQWAAGATVIDRG